jgi:hypothetical protein
MAEPGVQPQIGEPRRAQAAMALIALLALLCWKAMLLSDPEGGPDPAAVEKRFAPLRAALPPRGAVGYLSDSDFGGDYYLTARALAPLVVFQAPLGFSTYAPGSILVVGSFTSPAAIPRLLALNKLIVRQDFDNGVFLLEPETR